MAVAEETPGRFQVRIDAYRGPLDLLLYLVRREELPIEELPLAEVAQQYLDYVAVIEQLDAAAAAEFLDVASRLLEIKSRTVLPLAEAEPAEEEPVDEALDAPGDLVQRLLEFQEYRDAADRLETLRIDWSLRRTRSVARAPRKVAPEERPIEGVELWDLVSAFARIMSEREGPVEEESLVNDETPIHVHMQRIDARLRSDDTEVALEDLFPDGPVHRSALVGLFVAILELVRHGHATVRQASDYGSIYVSAAAKPLSFAVVGTD